MKPPKRRPQSTNVERRVRALGRAIAEPVGHGGVPKCMQPAVHGIFNFGSCANGSTEPSSTLQQPFALNPACERHCSGQALWWCMKMGMAEPTSSRTRMPAGCVCSAPDRLSSASLPGVPTTSSGLFCFMASTCAFARFTSHSSVGMPEQCAPGEAKSFRTMAPCHWRTDGLKSGSPLLQYDTPNSHTLVPSRLICTSA